MTRLFILLLLIVGQANAQITGAVFRDFNGNGTKDATEPLMPGVTVRAYNAAGTLCDSTVSVSSTAATNYTLTSCGTGDVRVEFSITAVGVCIDPTFDQNALGGAGYGSSVQFVKGNSTNVNFALYDPDDYALTPSAVNVYVPCYVNGDPLPGGSASGTTDWFVGFPYTNTGTTPAPTQKLNGAIIGSTWGVAYSKQAGKIFTSAFLKRHVGLGTLGSGGIYMLTPTPTSFSVVSFYDMDANGYRTRAASSAVAYGSPTSFTINAAGTIATFRGPVDPLTGQPEGLGVIGTNAGRGLPTALGTPSYDPAVFDQTGKVGLGDIEISDDGRFLFVMNLYSRRLFRLELNDPVNPTSVVNVTSFPIPTVSCGNGVLRPFAVKFQRDKVYIGAVCSGENGGTNAIDDTYDASSTADLQAFVFRLDNPTLGTAAFSNTPVISFPLNYRKGSADGGTSNQWYPWTNIAGPAGFLATGSRARPSPILSNIDFSDRGDLLLNFMDRHGNQYGYGNQRYLATTFDVSTDPVIGGDLLVAGVNCNGTYTLERDARFTSLNGQIQSQFGVNNLQGPGSAFATSGEFFTADNQVHNESSMGAFARLPGQDEVMFTMMDPIVVWSGGVRTGSTTTGSAETSYQLYSGAGFGGKANGLGDLELSASFAPIEIGNRVWVDADQDGIQDAGESALPGAEVRLYDATKTTLLATAITDATGEYYFTNSTSATGLTASYVSTTALQPNTAYALVVANLGSSGLSVTAISPLTPGETGSVNSGTTTTNNDARLDNVAGQQLPCIKLTTGPIGSVNHTYDFGFLCVPPPTLVATVSQSICQGSPVSLNVVGAPGMTFQWFVGSTGSPAVSTAASLTTPAINSPTTYIVRGTLYGCATNDTPVVLTPVVCQTCTVAPTTIGGVVFRDFNSNGIDAANDPGIPGVTVTLFRCDANGSSTQAGQTQTDLNGNYSFTGLTAGTTYRVEFSNYPAGYEPTYRGTNNGTSAQFVLPGTCNASLGLNHPADYCQTNPRLATPCYVNGAVSGAVNVGGAADALVSFNYDFTNDGKATDGARSDIGSTWGLAFSKQTRQLYAASFLKRHVGLKDGKLGVIYVKDYTNPTGPMVPWLDVSTLGLAGNWQFQTDTQRGVALFSAPSADPQAFSNVATAGLGDIDISDDGKTLYAMDLTNRQLLAIDVATKTLIGQYPVPAICTANSAETQYYKASSTTVVAGGQTWRRGIIWNTNNAGLEYAQPITNPNDPVAGTTDASLYATSVYNGVGNTLLYEFPIGNGSYSVKMHLATNGTGTNRNTSVVAEGNTVISGLDVYAASGNQPNRALTRTFTATVSDGVLSISAINGSGSTFVAVSGFEITPLNPAPTGVTRPFATKFYRGKVYVGAVCDASRSQDRDDMQASVFAFDPATSTYTPVLNFPLNYPKGSGTGALYNSDPNRGWRPWTSVYPNNTALGIAYASVPGVQDSYEQAVLSDIEFDVDGSMILGFFDRFGHQIGAQANFRPDRPGSTALTSNFGITAGDMLRAYYNGTGFEIERNAREGISSQKPPTAGRNNDQGPNGGEFYWDDIYPGIHWETSMGGLALLPGSGEVRLTFLDPIVVFTGGIQTLNNTTGGRVTNGGLTLYTGVSGGLFNKANGLGDLELFCNVAPIQIGNRVWRDDNRNGVQDPCEPPIPGAVVQLYDAAKTTVLASATTNAAGEYYFMSATTVAGTSTSAVATTALQANTTYGLVISSLGSSTVVTGLSLTDVSPLTPGESGTINTGTTLANNDAKVDVVGGVRLPCIKLTTGGLGENNHTYDFGIAKVVCSLTLTAQANGQPSATVCAGQSVTLSAQATPAGSYTYTWSAPGNVTLSPSVSASLVTTSALPGGSYTFVVTASSTPTCSTTASVVVTVNPATVFNPTTPIVVCQGSTVSFGPTLPAGASAFWTTPASTTISSSTVSLSNIQPTDAGIYTLFYTNPQGCTSTSTQSLSVNVPPTLSVVSLGCTSSGASYTVLVSTNAAQFATNALGATIAGNLITVPNTVATITVSATSAAGCVATLPVTGPVCQTQCPPLSVTATASSQSLCAGGTVTLSARTLPTNPGSYSYAWSAPQGVTLTGANAAAATSSSLAAGVYTFGLTVTSQPGCFTSTTVSVTVNAPTTLPAFTPISVCAGSSVTFGVNLEPGATANWTTPASTTVSSATVSLPNATTADSGVYGLSYTNAAGCTSIPASQSVTVSPQPVLSAAQTLTCNAFGQAPASTTLSATGAAGGTWTAAAANPASTTFAASASLNTSVSGLTAPGTYTFVFTAPGGCSATTTVTIPPCNCTLTMTASASSPTLTVGQNATLSASVTPQGSYTYVWSGPNGVTITPTNAATVTASGLPVGTSTFSVTAISTNPACFTTATVSVMVLTPTLSVSVGQPVCNTATNQYTATGTVSLSNVPAGTTLTLTDNAQSLTTVTLTPGQTLVSFSTTVISDATPHTVVATLTTSATTLTSSTTYAAPASCTACSLSITTTALAGGTVGTAYSQTIALSGANATSATFAALGSLPAGLSLNAGTGVLSGTPTAATTTSFTVLVTGTQSCTAQVPLTLTTVCPALSLMPQTLPSGQQNQPYSQTLTASGGTPAYSYSVVGTLPAGLSLTGGVFSGTPSTTGTGSFTLAVTDRFGCGLQVPYTIGVSALPVCSLTVTATPGVCSTATNQYSVTGTVSATNAALNAASPQTLTVTVGSSSSTVVTLTGNGPVNYTLNGLVSDGQVHMVTVLSSATVCSSASQTFTAPQACTVAPPTGSIGDYVWVDVNNNGLQDNTDLPADGVIVELYTVVNNVRSLTPIASTVTNTSGLYGFSDLPSGNFQVKFTIPASATASVRMSPLAFVGNDRTIDSDVVPTSPSTGFSPVVAIDVTQPASSTARNNPTIDAALRARPGVAITDPCRCYRVEYVSSEPRQLYEVVSVSASPGESWTIVGQRGMYLADSITYTPIAVPSRLINQPVGSGTYSLTFTHTDAVGYSLTATNGVDTLAIANRCQKYPTVTSTIISQTMCRTDAPVALTAVTNPSGSARFFYVDKITGQRVFITQFDPSQFAEGDTIYVKLSVPPVSASACETILVQKVLISSVACNTCVQPNLVAQASSSTLTPGQNVTLTTSTSLPGSYSYVWSGPNGVNFTPANAATVVASNLPLGTTTFSVTAISSNPTCFTSSTVSVTVLSPALSVTVGTPVCNTATNQYTATGTVSLSNAVAGTLLITDNGTTIGPLSITAGQTTASFPVYGVSNAASHTVIATLTGFSSASTVYTAPASCTSGAPAYTIAKTVSQNRVEKGSIVTYTLTLTNIGNATASNLVVGDQLSTTAVTFVGSATTSTGTFLPAGNSGSWTIASLGAGQVATLRYQVQINAAGLIHNTATAPDGSTVTACLTVPIQVCANSDFEFRLAALAGYSTYQWSRNGVLIPGATTAFYNATEVGEYTAGTGNVASCPFVIEAYGPLPSLTAVAVAGSCTNGVPVNDAKITLVGSSTNAVSYNISRGSSFTAAAPLFATSQPIPAVLGDVLRGGLASPASAPGDAYTIRVYTSSGCFNDIAVVIPPAQCQCPPPVCVPMTVKRLR